MPNEELEKLKQKQHGLETKLTAAKHKEKQLEHKLKQLTRRDVYKRQDWNDNGCYACDDVYYGNARQSEITFRDMVSAAEQFG